MRIYISICLAIFLISSLSYADEKKINERGWLIGVDSDAERFELLQHYLRGFDQPMWEVGERFKSIHEALVRNNYELASYHWDKIKVTIENGYMKRPSRKQNAENIFLNTSWGEVKMAFESKDQQSARNGFYQASAACKACHNAESVPFMNDQSIFDLNFSTLSKDKEK